MKLKIIWLLCALCMIVVSAQEEEDDVKAYRVSKLIDENQGIFYRKSWLKWWKKNENWLMAEGNKFMVKEYKRFNLTDEEI